MATAAKVICFFIVLAIMTAFPIAMICLGALHMNECPMQPWVPTFLVVAGGVGVVLSLLTMCRFGCTQSENVSAAKYIAVLMVLLGLFLLGWNIAGSIWVFKEWKHWDSVKDSKEKGCYNDMYLLAFAYLIIFWISCPCQMGSSYKSKKDQSHQTVVPELDQK